MPLLHNTIISAVIFDLDGTLVTSEIDFRSLQAAIGCAPGGDVLKFAEDHPDPDERARIMAIIEEIELADARSATLIDGAAEFVQKLHDRGYPVAIVTRNSSLAAMRKIERTGLPIAPEDLITREDAPPKPNPQALLHLATKWQLSPTQIAYVGDYHFDVDAALNAGMHACLRMTDHAYGTDYAERAHYCFDHYDQFFHDFFGKRENAA